MSSSTLLNEINQSLSSIHIEQFDYKNMSTIIHSYTKKKSSSHYFVQWVGGNSDVSVSDVSTKCFTNFNDANNYFIGNLSYLDKHFQDLVKTIFNRFLTSEDQDFDESTYSEVDYYYLYLLFGPNHDYPSTIFFDIDIKNMSISFYSSSLIKRPSNMLFLGSHPLHSLYYLWVKFITTKLSYPSADDINTLFSSFKKDEWCIAYQDSIDKKLNRLRQQNNFFYHSQEDINSEIEDELEQYEQSLHYFIEENISRKQ